MPDSLYRLRRKFPLKTEILQTAPDYYTFVAWKENSGWIYRDTVWRLRGEKQGAESRKQ